MCKYMAVEEVLGQLGVLASFCRAKHQGRASGGLINSGLVRARKVKSKIRFTDVRMLMSQVFSDHRHKFPFHRYLVIFFGQEAVVHSYAVVTRTLPVVSGLSMKIRRLVALSEG
jgi:hypothetical protein